MFSRLSESIKKTAAIADGWGLGRLIFEKEDCGWVPYIEMGSRGDIDSKEYIDVNDHIEIDDHIVEVLNGDEWHTMTEEDYKRVTAEGWPLFGGFDCKYKYKKGVE